MIKRIPEIVLLLLVVFLVISIPEPRTEIKIIEIPITEYKLVETVVEVPVEVPVEKEFKFFSSMDELREWQSQYDSTDMYMAVIEANATFYHEYCVGHATGLQILAAKDGYLLQTDLINQGSHMVCQAIIGEVIINFEPLNPEFYTMVSFVGKPK